MRLALVALFFALPATAAAQAAVPPAEASSYSPETTKALDRLMRASEVEAQFDGIVTQVFQTMMTPLLAHNPGRERELSQILNEEMIGELRKQKPLFIRKMRDLYAQRFNADEINKLAAFLESPLGRKMVREQAGIAIEMAHFGQQVGMAAAEVATPRILDRLRAAKLNLPPTKA